MQKIIKNKQYYKFCFYGFFKNLRFFEPFLILFFLDKGLNFIEIGTLYAVRELAINFIEIPSGIIADALGRRKTLAGSFLAYIIAFVVFTLFSNYWPFLFGMIFYSIGDGFRTGTHKAMIYDYLRLNKMAEQKVNYYGHTRSWSQIGSAFNSLLAATIVIITKSYEWIFILSIIPYLADLALILSYPKILDGEIKSLHKEKVWQNFKIALSEVKQSFSNKNIWITIGNLSLYQGLFRSLKDYLQPIIVATALSLGFLSNLGIEKQSALLIGIIYFGIFMLTSFVSRNSGRFIKTSNSSANWLNITLLLGSLIAFLAGFTSEQNFHLLAIFLFVLLFAIQNLRKPIGTAYLADEIKPGAMASGLSINSQFDSLIAALFAIIIGVIAEFKNINIAIISIGVICLLLTPIFILKKKSKA